MPNLDAAEVILFALFAHAAETVGSLLLTGDKRSIEAVANVPECADLARRLAGRVLCMEQVLLRVIDAQGFDAVKFRIVNSNALHLDTAVRAAFGSGMQALVHNAVDEAKRQAAFEFDGVDSTWEQPPVSCRSGLTIACSERRCAPPLMLSVGRADHDHSR